MNYWWDMHAYQHSNKISPSSAGAARARRRQMITSALTTADRHEPDSQAVARIRTIGLQGLGTSSGAHRTA
jgi:hypothetical protein